MSPRAATSSRVESLQVFQERPFGTKSLSQWDFKSSMKFISHTAKIHFVTECTKSMIFSMPTLLELEPQVMTLQEKDRASLATTLLSSLPPALYDEDDGVTEALRREQEAEFDPSAIKLSVAPNPASKTRTL